MADNTYISKKMEQGTLNISDDVIAGIVRPAVLEVEGVADLAAAAGSSIAEYIGITTNSRGIKVAFKDDCIIVDVIVMVRFGSNIVDVARLAQEAVVSAVQTTTGIDDVSVNVHVAGVAF